MYQQVWMTNRANCLKNEAQEIASIVGKNLKKDGRTQEI